MQSKKYDFIDFLRGIAILFVFVNHIPRYEDQLFSNLSLLQRFPFSIGTYGVQLFYIVSAFTLLISLHNRKELSFYNFFIRRIFRIVPIFFLGIAFYSFYLNYRPTDFKNIILNLTFLNNIIPPSNDLIPGGATISAEMNFYMILPIMFLLINSYKKSLITIILVLFNLLFLNLYFEYEFVDQSFGEANFYRTIFCQIFIFLLGFLSFFIVRDFLDMSLDKHKIKKIIMAIVPVIFLFFLILIIDRREIEYFYFKNLMLISIILFIFVNITFMISERILNNPLFIIIKNIGKVSFSMYVWHWVVVGHIWNNYFLFIDEIKGKMILFIFTSLIVTYLVSLISYQIEKFFINYGKKFIKRI
tara:strand:+ start:1744 stop:2820 length:1077 start_codon:yes stop_codon:yes gene_type:complete